MKTKLENWGYTYNYSPNGVEITGKPDSPEERLKEILIRKLNLSVQTDPYAFACFICAFRDIRGFVSMPWAEREFYLKEKYGITITERTLRSWCSTLIGSEVVQKSGEMSFWKTEMFGNEKVRTKISKNDPERRKYIQKKNKYLDKGRAAAADGGLIGKEANKFAWKFTYNRLWQKFKCCYYSCSRLIFTAIGEDYLFEIYELVEEIAAAPVAPPPEPKKIITKEEYHGEWFRSKKHL